MLRSADIVRIARRRAGLSQRELAKRLGRPQSTVARWEAGHVEPSAGHLQEAVRACGLELGLELYRYDDSYTGLIAEQLRLPPSERLQRLLPREGEPFDPVTMLRALEAAGLRYVTIGRVAAALRGSPIALGRRAVEICPQPGEANRARLEQALRSLGARRLRADARYGDLHAIERWQVDRAGGKLHAIELPAGTRGYADLAQDAERLPAAEGVAPPTASTLDLLRIADAAPREEDRSGSAALRELAGTEPERAAA